MLPSSAKNSGSFAVSTPSDNEIQLTRLFDAPRELVFEVMSQPEHVRRWWGNLGADYSVPVCEIDLRPGGAWRFINAHPKGQAEFYGTYQEVTPPSRIVFTEIFAPFPESVSVVTADLIEEEGKTRLIATVRYPSQEIRDMVIATGMAKGAATSYDRLEDLLQALSTEPRY